MKEEITLKLHETYQSASGLRITFESLVIEQIAADPLGSKAYPSGSGVSVAIRLQNSKGESHEILLNLLSQGYESRSSVEWENYKISLVETESEYKDPKAIIRVEALPSPAKPP